jgi:site-specific recombinase XerD
MSASITQHVFCNRDGVPYRSFRSAFDRAVQKAELGDLPFHDLRHVFASRLIMNGVDFPTVKGLPGHKVIAMTLHYTYLSSDHKRQAAQTLELSTAKVPAIFTTRCLSQSSSSSQLAEIAPVPR